MRTMPATMTAAWNSGNFVGDDRPCVRVTVQHPKMQFRKYSLTSTFSLKKEATIPQILAGEGFDLHHGFKVNQMYANFLFGTATDVGFGQSPMGIAHTIHKPMELPNVKTVTWDRSIDADVAECTVEVFNTAPYGDADTVNMKTLDQPGYYTYDRGGSAASARWKQTRNAWFGMLVPDNLLRTYEGYGQTPDVPPELDPRLVQTGLWIIDSVSVNDQGAMSIKCRDIGRILIDQIYSLPVVPKQFYNENWKSWTGKFDISPTVGKLKVKATHSSNEPWFPPGSPATVAGHKLSYAFDGDPSTYWVSIGNVAASRRFAYEWVQCKVGNQAVSQVKVRTKKKGYTVYVSCMVGGVWQGARSINYHEDGIGMNGSDINYVASAHVDTEQFVTIKFKAIKKVQAVRVTLGNLQNFKFGTYTYRGGIRDVEVYGVTVAGKEDHFTKGPVGSNPNRYYDYTDIVKLLCAWGGFFWPANAVYRDCEGTYRGIAPTKFDTRVLGKGVRGRVWGDFQRSKVAGVAELDSSNFDRQSLMDCISYIRDILGFIFHIDETGGVIWRLPNVHNYGSRRGTLSPNPKYLDGVVHHIYEDTVLLSLNSTIDGKNVRESFFVGDVEGKLGAFAPGFNPNPTGLRRLGGWIDQNFSADPPDGTATDPAGKNAQKQAQLMADMIQLRQLFSYRNDRVRIPANPAIQIDDQIRIYERSTSEGYIHYVKGISSNLNVATGEWTYDLETHWLGYDKKGGKWLFNPKSLHATTQAYLTEALEAGRVDEGPSRIEDRT